MNNLFGQNHDLDSLKPLHDQFRQKYGNYSNEKYPDFNVALKAEICERKWKPCSLNSNTDLYENLSKSVNNSSSDEAYSQKSFKQNESKLTQLGIPNRQDDLPKPKLKPFDFGESDSDSKASNSGSGSRLEDWPPSMTRFFVPRTELFLLSNDFHIQVPELVYKNCALSLSLPHVIVVLSRCFSFSFPSNHNLSIRMVYLTFFFLR
jgi:hypothetical protein